MNQFKPALCFLGLVCGIGVARGDLVFSDSFTYPDGNLVGATGSPWNAHSGAADEPVVVQDGKIQISRSLTQDVNADDLPGAPFTSAGPITVLYAGFSTRFTALPSAGSYFAHFNASSNMRGRLWATTNGATSSGVFRLGTTSASGTLPIEAIHPAQLELNTDYLVVMRLNVASGETRIWINPGSEESESAASTDVPGTFPSVSTFAFRQNTGIGIMLIDHLIIGTSFADVAGGNLPPTVSAIVSQSIPADASTGPIAFAVGDDQTPAEQLTPAGSSDNQLLVPDGNIVFGGSGGNRTVTVTPAAGQQGQANITISVSDGSATAQTSFLLKVGAPGIDPIANQLSPANTVFGPLSFTVADAEEGAGALTVSATSSNQLLLPNGNLLLGGSGATRTLTATPATGQTGLTTITVTVGDGIQTAAQSFAITVHPVLGLLASDDFNRPDEYLVDWIKWIGHSGPPDELFITSNRLPLSQQLGGDASLPLIAEGSAYSAEGGHVFFASFVANFSELPAGAGTYFAHFKDTTNTFRARVIATTTGATGGKLRLGIASISSTAAPESLHPTELELNADHRVVVRLNAATGESRLWVNPSSEAAGYVDSTDPHFPSAIESFAFRQSGPSNPGMGVLTVDDLKIGTAFNDVVTDLPVTISYTVNANTLRLSWPAGQGYFLRRTIALPAAPADWSNVPFINEGANDVSNLDVSTGNGFFRLERSN